jgi:hypothetical protein
MLRCNYWTGSQHCGRTPHLTKSLDHNLKKSNKRSTQIRLADAELRRGVFFNIDEMIKECVVYEWSEV